MQIIHLSDIHFGNPEPAFELADLKQALNEFKDLFCNRDTFLVVSGDITFKGSSYGLEQAGGFFEEVWIDNGGSRKRFLVCPGNHDLSNNGFRDFDTFLYRIRRDHESDFCKESCRVLILDTVAFLLINSAHHLNHKYGLIDFEHLHKKLMEYNQDLSHVKNRIAVVHHHLLGIQEADISTIRNASPFLAVLEEFNFDLVLHGHQHAQASLAMGESQMRIFSGRSLNFQTGGHVNGISILSYIEGDWTRSLKFLSFDNSQISGLSFSSVEK